MNTTTLSVDAGRIIKAVVVVNDLLEHCREIYLNEPLCWSKIAHATSHSPYDVAEDSVAVAAPYGFTCAASVTHRSEV